MELWLSFLYGSYNGAMVVFLTEIMPAEVRTSGFSLAYSLATAIFGGFTPAISTYLIHATGNPAVPGLWLSAAALLGLIGAYFARPHRAAASDRADSATCSHFSRENCYENSTRICCGQPRVRRCRARRLSGRSGPAVIVMSEIPGITPQVAAFARGGRGGTHGVHAFAVWRAHAAS